MSETSDRIYAYFHCLTVIVHTGFKNEDGRDFQTDFQFLSILMDGSVYELFVQIQRIFKICIY